MASRKDDIELIEKYEKGMTRVELRDLVNGIWDDIEQDVKEWIEHQQKLATQLAKLGIAYEMRSDGVIKIIDAIYDTINDRCCMRCKHIEKCELAKHVKESTGMKYKEMCFYCFEEKE